MSRSSATPRGRSAPEINYTIRSRRGPSHAHPTTASSTVTKLLKRQVLTRCTHLVSHTRERPRDSSVNRSTSGVWEVPRMPTRPHARDDRLIGCRKKRERTRARERERLLILGVVSTPAALRPFARSGHQHSSSVHGSLLTVHCSPPSPSSTRVNPDRAGPLSTSPCGENREP
jgi:hypothetical protein